MQWRSSRPSSSLRSRSIPKIASHVAELAKQLRAMVAAVSAVKAWRGETTAARRSEHTSSPSSPATTERRTCASRSRSASTPRTTKIKRLVEKIVQAIEAYRKTYPLDTREADASKAVFEVEYGQPSLAATTICPKAKALNFDTLIKNLSLDTQRASCD